MKQKRHAALLAALAVTAGLQVQRLQAVPALPGVIQMLLPDGTSLGVRLHGDEHLHWYTTSDGYPLIRQDNGFFYYADISANGKLTATNVRAADTEQRTGKEKAILAGIDKAKVADRLSIRRADKAQSSPMKIMGETAYPTIGSHRTLALLVEFPKIGNNGKAVKFHFDKPKELFHNMLNKTGFDFNGATGSVNDYYKDCSAGQFDLTFDVYGPVTVSNDISYYGVDEEAHAWEMVAEACTALDSEIDFSIYDEDANGVIDNVYVFYAGQGEADGGDPWTIWPHAGDLDVLTTGKHMFDGVRLNHYACSSEIRVKPNPAAQRRDTLLSGIGNVCHEFTHVLGFPDLYNTRDQSASFTPGPWSLMDIGSYNNDSHTPPLLSAYERMSMGWLTPQTVSEPANIILEPLSANKACRINTPNTGEIFILENRQQEGWDKYLPGHGMLVWHISYEADRWQYNQVNTVDEYQCIDIEEADNIRSDYTRAGDAFPGTAGITQFTDYTYPGMLTQVDGKPCMTPVTDIEERNGQIHFKVNGGQATLQPVKALPATDITPLSFTANWEAEAEATAYKIDVWRQNGMEIEYAEGYRALPVEGTSCAVTGLSPETAYRYSVRATNASAESLPSNTVDVTTGVATFEHIAPTPASPTNITDTEFTANWLPLNGADGYTVSVYTKEKGVADTIGADFTGGVKNMPEGWRTDCQMCVATAGHYGKAAPSLSMSADYSYIESPPLSHNVRGVRFWYRERNNPSGENRIEVNALAGSAWTTVETVSLPLPAAKGTVVEIAEDKIPPGTKAIRIVYRQTGSGALAIDDIDIAYNDKLHRVYLTGWEERRTGNVNHATVNRLQPLTDYYYTLRGCAGSVVTIPSAETQATTAKPSAIADRKAGANGISISRSGNSITISCNGAKAETAEIYTAGGQLIARNTAGAGANATFTLPHSGIYIIKVAGNVCKITL